MGRYVSVAGVIVGGIADVVFSAILMIPIGVFLVATALHGTKAGTAEQTAQLHVVMQTATFIVATQITSALGSIFGGFVAAAIAKREDLLNGLLSTWVCVISGVIGIFVEPDLLHRLGALVDIPICAALGVLGGYLRLRTVRAKRVTV